MKVWGQCKACGGTGLNTSGNQCYPCSVHGVEVEAPHPIDGSPGQSSKHTTKIEPEDDPAMGGFL